MEEFNGLEFPNLSVGDLQIDTAGVVYHQNPEPIPLELQLAYYTVSAILSSLNMEGEEEIQEEAQVVREVSLLLHSGDAPEATDLIKFAQLAKHRNPRIVRLVDEWIADSTGMLRSVLQLVRLELTTAISQGLDDEHQHVLVLSGLGGDDQLLRFGILLMVEPDVRWSETQCAFIEEELRTLLGEHSITIEEVHTTDQYIMLIVLVPRGHDLDATLETFIRDANQYGAHILPKAMYSNHHILQEHEILTLVAQQHDKRRQQANTSTQDDSDDSPETQH